MRTILPIVLFLSAATHLAAQESRFTISKETTHLLGPVGADGYIDYTAAMNKRLGAGVTPENNAVVLLWQACGPKKGIAQEYFNRLGMQVPDVLDDHYVDLRDVVAMPARLQNLCKMLSLQSRLRPLSDLTFKQSLEVMNEEQKSSEGPWKAKDHRRLAYWISLNHTPVEIGIEATKRPRYFSPLMRYNRPGVGHGLIGTQVHSVHLARPFADILRSRALMRLGHGDHAGAWQDLLACHRLARLVSQGGTTIDMLVSRAIEGMACSADINYLQHVRPDAAGIRKCLEDLRSLPALVEIAEVFHQYERWTFLDQLMRMRQDDPNFWLARGFTEQVGPLARRLLRDIHCDDGLRMANQRYDRLTAVLRQKDRLARIRDLKKFDADLKQQKANLHKLVGLAEEDKEKWGADWEATVRYLCELPTPQSRGKLVSDYFATCYFMFPAEHVYKSAIHAHQVWDNLMIALALVLHEREQGAYPEKLQALVPRYLKTVPLDNYSGQDLIYRRTAKGYVLYSVGRNGKDDGGHGWGNEPYDGGDDIVVRMPRK